MENETYNHVMVIGYLQSRRPLPGGGWIAVVATFERFKNAEGKQVSNTHTHDVVGFAIVGDRISAAPLGSFVLATGGLQRRGTDVQIRASRFTVLRDVEGNR